MESREESNDYDLTFGLTDDELTERFVQAGHRKRQDYGHTRDPCRCRW